MFDQVENFRNAIRKKKARNLIIDSILARPMIAVDQRGGIGHGSANARQNLAEEKVHNEEIIADLEGQVARFLLSGHSPKPLVTASEARESARDARDDDRTRQAVQLGEWAAGRCEELRKINTFALGKLHSQEAIREQFPDLRVWGEVIDRFYPTLRKKFFGEVNARKWNQVDLFEWMAHPWGISGARLYDHYKKYRSANGLGRKRGTARRKTRDEQPSPTHSKKHS